MFRILFEVCPNRRINLVSSEVAVTSAGLNGISQLLQRMPAFSALARFIKEKVSVVGEERMLTLADGDLLILAGGPIMDDPDLGKWHRWFLRARRCGAATVIAGCGMSPLRHPKAIALARALVALSDVVVVRDRPQARFNCSRIPMYHALDPAFLCAPLLQPLIGAKQPILAVNSRTIGPDSLAGRTIPAQVSARCVTEYAGAIGGWAELDGVLPFSTREGRTESDAVPSRWAAEALSKQLDVPMLPLPETSVTGMIDALLPCEYLVSTRMHGFIIGLMLGCRSVNLDYIGGGGKGSDLYRDWLGREAAPRLFDTRPLQDADFISLHDLHLPIEKHFTIYVDAIREALACTAIR